MSARRQQRIRAAAQAKAVDVSAIAITAGLGVMGVLAGLASLLH